MAINTNGSNIRSETNFKGQWFDQEAFTAAKAQIEHNAPAQPQSDRQWASSYVSPEVLSLWQQSNDTPDIDQQVDQANLQDLKIRGLQAGTLSAPTAAAQPAQQTPNPDSQ